MPYPTLILVCWLVFVLYWLISAVGVKRDIQPHTWRPALGLRLAVALLALLVLLVRTAARGQPVRPLRSLRFGAAHPLTAPVGVLLCALGIAFAIWARWHLGRNWSAVPTLKEGHELVTSGPYAYVRHPIYTGMLTALLGTALTLGWMAALVFVVCCMAFLWRVRVEEQLMRQQFPQEYAAYRARTKALIPFVW
jgi:protein-S-isoprenylcysteine O-methyltransferase